MGQRKREGVSLWQNQHFRVQGVSCRFQETQSSFLFPQLFMYLLNVYSIMMIQCVPNLSETCFSKMQRSPSVFTLIVIEVYYSNDPDGEDP